MLNKTTKILVIDDDAQIRRFLNISLTAHGYGVVEAPSGENGVSRLLAQSPDLVLLDLGLPDMDGQEVITSVRSWSKVPIIVLSARVGEKEKVSALDRGADDYVTKPFGLAELLARVRATLRARVVEENEPSEISSGELSVDLAHRKVRVGGQVIKLTKKEFDILRILARNMGRVVTHNDLMTQIWGPGHVDDIAYLRSYVRMLRKKLDDNPASPRFIENEPGIGYRLITS